MACDIYGYPVIDEQDESYKLRDAIQDIIDFAKKRTSGMQEDEARCVCSLVGIELHIVSLLGLNEDAQITFMSRAQVEVLRTLRELDTGE